MFSQLSGHGDTEQWFFFRPRQELERSKRWETQMYYNFRVLESHRLSCIIAENFVTNWCNSEAKAVVPPIKIKKANKKRAASCDPDLASSRDLDDTGMRRCMDNLTLLRHEFSLCQVYVTSGSLRAFDRRPPRGAETRMTMTQQVHGDRAATTSQNT
ncbi:hypothetical protein L1049_014328 [Liquidambar formosana]|uniref:Uncharacterized protein n=1 Tax=Liquidambar formosana TaxID=63359 RepID=A0AAP0RLX6_LIQFO